MVDYSTADVTAGAHRAAHANPTEDGVGCAIAVTDWAADLAVAGWPEMLTLQCVSVTWPKVMGLLLFLPLMLTKWRKTSAMSK